MELLLGCVVSFIIGVLVYKFSFNRKHKTIYIPEPKYILTQPRPTNTEISVVKNEKPKIVDLYNKLSDKQKFIFVGVFAMSVIGLAVIEELNKEK